MLSGILAGATWGIETVILGLALAMSPFCSTEQAILLAPFVSTFLHDSFSAVFATLYNALRGNLKNVWHALFRTRSGVFVAVAALIGGPVGMTGYVLCVNYMGASIGAIASAVFPAIGAALAFFFLKEKMQWYRWVLLLVTLLGVYGLSYSPDLNMTNFALGVLGALLCAFGWGIEAVILAKCLKDAEMIDEYALQIRQITSALINGLVVLPLVKGWGFTLDILTCDVPWLLPTIALAALFATASYLFYYRAIAQIGASKAMALNITYTAWALVFSVILLRDTTALSPLIIACMLIVLICGTLAAADYKELFRRKKTDTP